jgi:hypothetical protein
VVGDGGWGVFEGPPSAFKVKALSSRNIHLMVAAVAPSPAKHPQKSRIAACGSICLLPGHPVLPSPHLDLTTSKGALKQVAKMPTPVPTASVRAALRSGLGSSGIVLVGLAGLAVVGGSGVACGHQPFRC